MPGRSSRARVMTGTTEQAVADRVVALVRQRGTGGPTLLAFEILVIADIDLQLDCLTRAIHLLLEAATVWPCRLRHCPDGASFLA